MQVPPDQLRKFRRSSAYLNVEKSQPLGDKVHALLVSDSISWQGWNVFFVNLFISMLIIHCDSLLDVMY